MLVAEGKHILSGIAARAGREREFLVGASLVKHGQAGIAFIARVLFLPHDEIVRRNHGRLTLAGRSGNRIISQAELLGSPQLAEPCTPGLGQGGVERGQCGGAGGLRATRIVERQAGNADFLRNLVERCGFLKQVCFLGLNQRGKVVLPGCGIFYTGFQLVAGDFCAEQPV